MKNKIKKSLKINRILSTLTIFLGAILMIYMIKVEDEPGALPLLLIIIGTVWYIINNYQIKKQLQKNK